MIEHGVPTISDDVPGAGQADLVQHEDNDGDMPFVDVDEAELVRLARYAYRDSTDFFDASVRRRLEKNYSLASSRHPSGSKYHTEKYKHRSKVFRGKTQAAIRKNEAAAAVALFSTDEVADIDPENQDVPEQVRAAEAVRSILNYRATNDLKWFQTVIGAYHEAQVAGMVVSKQYWQYREAELEIPESQRRFLSSIVPTFAEVNKPVVELLPPENVRIHPQCDWTDPINSSPYLIVLYPMYLQDVKERMEDDWYAYEDSEIQAAGSGSNSYDSVRTTREGEGKPDPTEATASLRETDIVWVHENFMRIDGEEYVFFTLGDNLLLSVPMMLKEAYPHCYDKKRPFSWGTASIEPFKPYSMGLPERVEGAQIQANEIANQRFDNVALVLNRRYFAERNGGVDYRQLMNSVPGSVTLMDRLDAVKTDVLPDVTGSSYQEQNVVNADFDEQAGTFSNASISTNRQMNETVGGMKLLAGNSNAMAEYQLRIFVETWLEDVVRQLVKMIRVYEDNQTIRKITGDPTMTSADLSAGVAVRVNVGFGATDPQQRVQKLMLGLQTVGKVMPQAMSRLKDDEVISEVFGALGYKNGKRFFDKEKQAEDPKMQEMAKKIKELEQIIQTKQVEQQGRFKIEEMRAKTSMRESLLDAETKAKIKQADLAMKYDVALKDIESKLGIHADRFALDTMAELNRKMDVINQQKELAFKAATGRQGI